MDDCIFCKIVNKKIPCELLYSDDLVIAINDINPITPVHVLVVPKKHIESVADMQESDEALAGRLVLVAKKIAEQLGTSKGGYKLLLRVGPDGGQEVPHVHLHLLGGGALEEDIKLKKD
jgi:histidine triad (HIT) family protein